MRAFIAIADARAKFGLLGGALAAGGLALGIALSAGSGIDTVAAQDVVYFRIGAGAPGSPYYGLAGQLAGIISNPPGARECDGEGACGVEGLLGLAQTTMSPVDGIAALRQGSLEAALVSADIADAAFLGTGPFKDAGPAPELRAVANVGSIVLHIVVPKESKAQSAKDLAGKRVGIGVAGSDNALTAKVLLRAAGMPDKKAKLVEGELNAAAAKLLTGEIEALAVVEQMPSSEVASLMATGNYRLLGAQPVAKDVPSYVFLRGMNAPQYKGVSAMPALAVPTVLVVRADLPGQIADGLLRALWHSAEPGAEPAPGSIAPDMSRASIPWHPDAAAAYAELAKTAPAEPEAASPTN